MSAVMIIFTVIQVIMSLFLICVVLLQSGKNAGLSGAIAGAADTFLSKNKASTLEAKLAHANLRVAAHSVTLPCVLNLI